MAGTGYYTFGANASLASAAVYQDDAAQQLRIDLGFTNLGPPVGPLHQLRVWFDSHAQWSQFPAPLPATTCVKSAPSGQAGMTYAEQLAPYGGKGSRFEFSGSFSFSDCGVVGAPLLAFSGGVFDGVRGDAGSFVFVDSATGVLRGQLNLFDESLGQLWLDNATEGTPPNASVFDIPAECPKEAQMLAQSMSSHPRLSAGNSFATPTLDLDQTLMGTGTYSSFSAPATPTPATPARWLQDADAKQLLLVVGDTDTESWKQVNLYNESGEFIVYLEQGNPKCEKKVSPTYSDFVAAHTSPRLIYVGTATISEQSQLGDLQMFAGVGTVPGVEGGTEQAYYVDAKTKLVRMYDNLARSRGYGRLVLDRVTPTKPKPSDFDLNKVIVSWLKCMPLPAKARATPSSAVPV